MAYPAVHLTATNQAPVVQFTIPGGRAGIYFDSEYATASAISGDSNLTAGQFRFTWNEDWDAEVESEVTDALNAYDAPTKTEMDSGFAALPTAADNRAEMDSNSTQLALIVEDTGTDGVVVAAASKAANPAVCPEPTTRKDFGEQSLRVARYAMPARMSCAAVPNSGRPQTRALPCHASTGTCPAGLTLNAHSPRNR